jgi:hypothetical protein
MPFLLLFSINLDICPSRYIDLYRSLGLPAVLQFNIAEGRDGASRKKMNRLSVPETGTVNFNIRSE